MFRNFLLLLISLSFTSVQAYWQQKVNFKINVSLDDKEHVLRANEEITYINNSPDTLASIYLHLWPNAYSGESTALAKQLLSQGETSLYYYFQEDIGYIDSLDFKVKGEVMKWNYHPDYEDIALLRLNSLLLPGDTVIITTPFRVQLPQSLISRLGHDEQAYQITQWFPKPAVYDQQGWHPYPYLDQGEFYSEFGDFEVNITLPKNYLVAATGDLGVGSNNSEYDFLEKHVKETTEFLNKNIFPVGYSEFPSSSKQYKTLSFSQKNVHDFAWFTDKRWLVSHEYVIIPNSFKRVDTWSFYLPHNAKLWQKGIKYVNKSLLFYSEEVGDYPYNHCTAVDGDLGVGGGMEYPNVTIIGAVEGALALEEVIMHEVGHNWFYGMLGSDERAHPWMDEGVNSYFERKYMSSFYPEAKFSSILGVSITKLLKEDEPLLAYYYWYAYAYEASRGQDQAGNLTADEFYKENYGSIVYAKSAVLFNYLAEYLGQEVFSQAMRKYFEDWKFKHPSPEDLQLILENESKKDLTWFFQGLLLSNTKVDHGIKAVNYKDDSAFVKVLVKNNSTVKAPIKLDLIRNDSIVHSYWFDGFNGEKVLLVPTADIGHVDRIDVIEIDRDHLTPDMNRENNHYEFGVLFSKMEPFESKFLLSVPKQSKTQVFYVPFLAYNASDKMQLGIMMYNSSLVEKRMRYMIMPTYGYGSNRLGGVYKGIYSLYPKSPKLNKVNLSFEYKRNALPSALSQGGYFEKYEPKVTFILNRNVPTRQKITLRYSATNMFVPEFNMLRNEYVTAEYNLKNDRVVHPFYGSASAQLINGKQGKIWASFTQEFTLDEDENSIDVRLFAGVFVGQSATDLTHRFRLNAGNGADALVPSGDDIISKGMTDYLYDDVYIARFHSSTNFLSQQVAMKDGGFRTGLFLGANNSWLTSLNLTVPSPSIYLSVFADGGLYPSGDEVAFVYSGGIQVNVFKDIFEVYFPLAFSASIRDNYEAVGLTGYAQKIKFLFNIGQYYNSLD
ncbi:MAG: hypothetical protein ACJA0Q_001268 [Saprospiraceae bacterium]|jgi:hypothetical protein